MKVNIKIKSCFYLLFIFNSLIEINLAFSQPLDLQLPNVSTQQLLDQAKTNDAERVAFTKEKGAQIIPTPDGKSFFILWYPQQNKNSTTKPPLILTFNGHGSYAFDEFYLWQPMAEKHGFGILAVQWWLGQGEKLNDYYQMHQIYPAIETLLHKEGIAPGQVLAHGFSRGSANIYSLAFIDHNVGSHFIGATIANSGKIQADFPENRPLFNSRADSLLNTHWILFCGANDPHPDRDGCGGMTETKTFLQQHGGNVDLFIQDLSAAHGGFHRNPDNIEKALTTFKKIPGVKN